MKNEKWTRKNGAAVEGFEKWEQSPIFWPRKIGDCPYFRAYRNLADDNEATEEANFKSVFFSNPCAANAEPADFVVESDINWFRFIAGNTGSRFTFGVGAVVNLYRWRKTVIDDLKACKDAPAFVPWCENRVSEPADAFSSSGSPPGFGRTDGELVVPEFKPEMVFPDD